MRDLIERLEAAAPTPRSQFASPPFAQGYRPMTDLTERLRSVAVGEVTTEGLLMREAADMIEAQRVRIAELDATVREMVGV